MVTECVAILLIVLFIEFILVRTKHIDYAVSVMPTLIVPSTHLLAVFTMFATGKLFLISRPEIVLAFVDIISLSITCALFALFSFKIKSKKTRHIYLWTMVGYSIILTSAFIYQTYINLMAAL